MLSVANKPFMLSFIMLKVIMLSVILLSVVVLSVVAPHSGAVGSKKKKQFYLVDISILLVFLN